MKKAFLHHRKCQYFPQIGNTHNPEKIIVNSIEVPISVSPNSSHQDPSPTNANSLKSPPISFLKCSFVLKPYIRHVRKHHPFLVKLETTSIFLTLGNWKIGSRVELVAATAQCLQKSSVKFVRFVSCPNRQWVPHFLLLFMREKIIAFKLSFFCHFVSSEEIILMIYHCFTFPGSIYLNING